jgi:hypothetical protein
LSDELGVVAQTGVGAVLNKVLAGPFNISGNNGAADDNVLVGDLFGVDVHKHLKQNVTCVRTQTRMSGSCAHISKHAVVIVPFASSGRCGYKYKVPANRM